MAESFSSLLEREFLSRRSSLTGRSLARPASPTSLAGAAEEVDEGVKCDRTALKPVIDALYAFADLPRALDYLDRGAFGKVVTSLA